MSSNTSQDERSSSDLEISFEEDKEAPPPLSERELFDDVKRLCNFDSIQELKVFLDSCSQYQEIVSMLGVDKPKTFGDFIDKKTNVNLLLSSRADKKDIDKRKLVYNLKYYQVLLLGYRSLQRQVAALRNFQPKESAIYAFFLRKWVNATKELLLYLDPKTTKTLRDVDYEVIYIFFTLQKIFYTNLCLDIKRNIVIKHTETMNIFKFFSDLFEILFSKHAIQFFKGSQHVIHGEYDSLRSKLDKKIAKYLAAKSRSQRVLRSHARVCKKQIK